MEPNEPTARECVRTVYRHLKRLIPTGRIDEFEASIMMETLNQALRQMPESKEAVDA